MAKKKEQKTYNKKCQNRLCNKEFETNRPQKKFCCTECRKISDKVHLYLDEEGKLPTILVDTRENRPFKFRACSKCAGHEMAALPYGDYTIKGNLGLIVVERKQSVDEIVGNLFRESERFERELSKMQDSRYRYIVIEDYYSQIFNSRYASIKGDIILDRLSSLSIRYGVNVIFAGTREMAGRVIRSLLLEAVKNQNRGTLFGESNKEE